MMLSEDSKLVTQANEADFTARFTGKSKTELKAELERGARDSRMPLDTYAGTVAPIYKRITEETTQGLYDAAGEISRSNSKPA